jgi:DNA-directed RNA polymerase subunit beta
MEVWALEGHGAAHTLREMLTLKSDDVTGRRRLYEAIVNGGPYPEPAASASLEVLLQELEALGMTIGFVTDASPAATEPSAPAADRAGPAPTAVRPASG